MEDLADVLEVKTIKLFLRRFPKTIWAQVLNKALKYGIYSIENLEAVTRKNLVPSVDFIKKSNKKKDNSVNLSFNTPKAKLCREAFPIGFSKNTPKNSNRNIRLKSSPKANFFSFDMKETKKGNIRRCASKLNSKAPHKVLYTLNKNSSRPNKNNLNDQDIQKRRKSYSRKENLKSHKYRKPESKNDTLAYMTSSSENSFIL